MLFKIFDSKSLISFSFFIKDKIIWIAGLAGLVLNIFLWLILYLKMPRGDDFFALHYNIYFGIDKVGSWYEIFIYPFTGLIILFVNFLLAYIFYKKERFLSYLLIISGSFAGLIIVGATLLILMTNI